MRETKKTNQNLAQLITQLRAASHEHGAPIWRDIAKRLDKPRRNWAEVNVSRIARFAKENEILVVPGKLLATGDISVPVTVAPYRSSRAAEEKIEKAGGRVITIQQLVAEVPKGTSVRIMG